MDPCLYCTPVSNGASIVEQQQQQQQQQQQRLSTSQTKGYRDRRWRLPANRRSTKRSLRQGRCATASARIPQLGAEHGNVQEAGKFPAIPAPTVAPEGNEVQEDAAPAEAATPQSVFDEGCDEQVVVGLAIAIERMAALATRAETVTDFHCASAPAMSIRDYIDRVRKFFGCSIECYVVGLVYIDRLVKHHPDIVVSPLSCHRLLITSILLAAKFQDDVFYTNTFYAKVGGLKLNELNVLEQRMLGLLDYRLFVPPSEYELYRRILCRAAGASASA